MSPLKPASAAEHQVFLSLGSNLGDRGKNLADARRLLSERQIKVLNASPVYETKPVGPQDQDDFLNQALEIQTALAPLDLLKTCQNIEQQLGRERTRYWGPRTIDIDILLYDDEHIDCPLLVIPHPHMHQRAFVLAPLADIAPEIMIKGESIKNLLNKLDHSGIRLADTQ